MLGKKIENFMGTTKIQHPYPPPKEKNLGPLTSLVVRNTFCLPVFFAILNLG
jgi:hypothetical protein